MHTETFLVGAFCGLALHLAFNKYEHTRHLKAIKQACMLVPLIPSYLFSHSTSHLFALFFGYAICYSSLIASIIVYRVSPLHPLSQYPGPLLAKCSKFWGVYATSTGKKHVIYAELHRTYGSVVRVGPNELSITDVNLLPFIIGANGMAKGPLWDGRASPGTGNESITINTRDKVKHMRLRKPWHRAFSIANVKDYEPLLQIRIDEIVDRLHRESDNVVAVDLAQWISFLAYDFMGDIVFGANFSLVREGDIDELWNISEKPVRYKAIVQHLPWILDAVFSFAHWNKDTDAARYLDFVARVTKTRMNRREVKPWKDLSYFLLGEDESLKEEGFPLPLYMGMSYAAVLAGSGTTATVLSSAFFYILSTPTYFLRVRAEVDQHFPMNEGKHPQDDIHELARMPLLNAVLNEALRLSPALPTDIQRATEVGSGGRMCGSIYIPEATAINVPPYAIQRDPRYFSPKTNEFWPERWLCKDDKSIVLNEAAFLAYSAGTMNCVGKPIAQMEMRVAMATIVQQFDMELKPGWDHSLWEAHLEDYFVLTKGELPVIVRPRMNKPLKNVHFT